MLTREDSYNAAMALVAMKGRYPIINRHDEPWFSVDRQKRRKWLAIASLFLKKLPLNPEHMHVLLEMYKREKNLEDADASE